MSKAKKKTVDPIAMATRAAANRLEEIYGYEVGYLWKNPEVRAEWGRMAEDLVDGRVSVHRWNPAVYVAVYQRRLEKEMGWKS